MTAEELIIRFHELTCEKNALKKRNSQLFCKVAGNVPGSKSCIGRMIEQIRSEKEKLPDTEFGEMLSKNGCQSCIEIWENKMQMKVYSKQVGIVKNQMHAYAKRSNKKLA